MMDTVKTVLWAMIGIRSKSAHEQAKIRPAHVVILAIMFRSSPARCMVEPCPPWPYERLPDLACAMTPFRVSGCDGCATRKNGISDITLVMLSISVNASRDQYVLMTKSWTTMPIAVRSWSAERLTSSRSTACRRKNGCAWCGRCR